MRIMTTDITGFQRARRRALEFLENELKTLIEQQKEQSNIDNSYNEVKDNESEEVISNDDLNNDDINKKSKRKSRTKKEKV
jgi:hypothetical protein